MLPYQYDQLIKVHQIIVAATAKTHENLGDQSEGGGIPQLRPITEGGMEEQSPPTTDWEVFLLTDLPAILCSPPFRLGLLDFKFSCPSPLPPSPVSSSRLILFKQI